MVQKRNSPIKGHNAAVQAVDPQEQEQDTDYRNLNVYERINKIRQEVPYVAKDAKVQGYKAVTHDQVTAHLRKSLIRWGIIVVPSLIEGATVQDTGMKTGSGIPYIRYEATYRVTFYTTTPGKGEVSIVVSAHALDQGDKAPGKAMSYATKYAMLKVFNIETGEDDEGRQVGEAPKLSPEQIDSIITFIGLQGWDMKTSVERLATTLGAEKIEDVPEYAFDKAMTVLTRAAQKKASAGEKQTK